MESIHKNTEIFAEAIDGASELFGYNPSHIEKDYYVTKMLKEIATSEYGSQAFFKGGTSLSKAYHILERFSEDLDMLTYSGDLSASKSKEKALNKKVCNVLVAENSDYYKPELSKTGGNFRKLYFDYGSQYPGVGLKPYLEVEIKACDFADKSMIYYPTEKKQICSIIGEFLSSIGRDDLVKQYGLEPFEIGCINPRKTICDKISRMVKLSYRENPIEEFGKHIRDLYDLHVILMVKEYKDFLLSADFLDAMYRTTIEDQLMKNSKTDMPLDQAVIFADTESITGNSEVIKAYTDELGKLFFKNAHIPALSDITKTIKEIASRMPEFEIYRSEKDSAKE